ncbi:hypothetical protein BEH_09575 [Priestia filamentosa]|uniref:Uncharacterized protein n=1 Tax=Priestia filamentosa TaxID=1402861 RepID=A0A1X7E3C0_9BACI|nr:hypothetical protein BEH_09575 [Priestia filamentosa]OXS68923.1 hypothetical protein B1B01_07990 [Priestia filamentosa]RJS64373.1 hypothetical protein CJ485_06325 [Priestia filamentosa]SMF26214.1 hypothetical protein SAMN06296056_102159 [Priestia filamentosa]
MRANCRGDLEGLFKVWSYTNFAQTREVADDRREYIVFDILELNQELKEFNRLKIAFVQLTKGQYR